MYGKVAGPMTENTPYAPCSKKGEIRAKIATALMNEVQAGGLSAMIARSADFYGPDTQNLSLIHISINGLWFRSGVIEILHVTGEFGRLHTARCPGVGA